jgi:hypothetical protein
MVAGAYRITVEAFGPGLLAPTSFQGFVYAQDEWPFRNERLYEQSQQDAARLAARPAGTAEDPMVAMEALMLIQAPIARKVELSVRRPGGRMAPARSTWAFRQRRLENSGANGAKSRIIVVGRVCASITSFERAGDERTLPPSLTNG